MEVRKTPQNDMNHLMQNYATNSTMVNSFIMKNINVCSKTSIVSNSFVSVEAPEKFKSNFERDVWKWYCIWWHSWWRWKQVSQVQLWIVWLSWHYVFNKTWPLGTCVCTPTEWPFDHTFDSDKLEEIQNITRSIYYDVTANEVVLGWLAQC